MRVRLTLCKLQDSFGFIEFNACSFRKFFRREFTIIAIDKAVASRVVRRIDVDHFNFVTVCVFEVLKYLNIVAFDQKVFALFVFGLLVMSSIFFEQRGSSFARSLA
jgi:hypothetical protein